jgi:hypothetical protein
VASIAQNGERNREIERGRGRGREREKESARLPAEKPPTAKVPRQILALAVAAAKYLSIPSTSAEKIHRRTIKHIFAEKF